MGQPERIWEIDWLRGLALIFMMVFHLVFDLTEFYRYPLQYELGFWFYIGRTSAILFILLCGVSTMFSSNPFRHGLILIGWGMLITVCTYIYAPVQYIRFGILHLLGVSLVTDPLLRRAPSPVLPVAAVLIMAGGSYISRLHAATDVLLIFGLKPAGFVSLDYYPLLPWYGVFLLGTFAGRLFYSGRRSILPNCHIPIPLGLLGQHSLAVYLLHQPVFVVILYALHALSIV